jgi:hypothetical protein
MTSPNVTASKSSESTPIIRLIDQNHNQFDTLDAAGDEPFTLESFRELIECHQAEGKSFIIARVDSEVYLNPTNGNMSFQHSNSSQSINTHRSQPGGLTSSCVQLPLPSSILPLVITKPIAGHRFYYSANHLNKVLFRKYGQHGEYIFRLYALNPLTNTPICGDVHYYLVMEDWDQEEESQHMTFKERLDRQQRVRKDSNPLSNVRKHKSKQSESFDTLMKKAIGEKDKDIRIAEITGPCALAADSTQLNRLGSLGSTSAFNYSLNQSQQATSRQLPAEFVTMQNKGGIQLHEFKRPTNGSTAMLSPVGHATNIPFNSMPALENKMPSVYVTPDSASSSSTGTSNSIALAGPSSNLSKQYYNSHKASRTHQSQDEETVIDLGRVQLGILKSLQERKGESKQLIIRQDVWKMKLTSKSKPLEHTFYSTPVLTQAVGQGVPSVPQKITNTGKVSASFGNTHVYSYQVPSKYIPKPGSAYHTKGEGQRITLLSKESIYNNLDTSLDSDLSTSIMLGDASKIDDPLSPNMTDPQIQITERVKNYSAQTDSLSITPTTAGLYAEVASLQNSDEDQSTPTNQGFLAAQSFDKSRSQQTHSSSRRSSHSREGQISYKAVYIGSDDDFLTRPATRAMFAQNALRGEDPSLFDIPYEVLVQQGILIDELMEVSISHMSLREMERAYSAATREELRANAARTLSLGSGVNVFGGRLGMETLRNPRSEVAIAEEDEQVHNVPLNDNPLPPLQVSVPTSTSGPSSPTHHYPNYPLLNDIHHRSPAITPRKNGPHAFRKMLSKYKVWISLIFFVIVIALMLFIALAERFILFLIPLIVLGLAIPVGIQCSQWAAKYRAKERPFENQYDYTFYTLEDSRIRGTTIVDDIYY